MVHQFLQNCGHLSKRMIFHNAKSHAKVHSRENNELTKILSFHHIFFHSERARIVRQVLSEDTLMRDTAFSAYIFRVKRSATGSRVAKIEIVDQATEYIHGIFNQYFSRQVHRMQLFLNRYI